MAVVRKKQDDKYLKVLRELVTTGAGNRQCFDCGQKGPTYVNMTIGSFVCTRCSGVLRGLTPPHRVKSISMATFTQEEIDFLKAHGNDLCAKTWLGLWDPKRAVHQDHRELMIDKYERKRYYLEPASPLKSLTNAASLKSSSSNKSITSSSSHMQQQPLTNGYGGNHSALNNNHSSAINISNSNKQSGGGFDSSFQNITLTPPASQRTTQNGLQKSTNSSTAISRPQNGYHHQQHQQQQHDAFMSQNGGGGSSFNGNGLHGLNASIGSGSASTGALSDTSSCASNGFGPEADFVADFGSANIFDATSAGSVGSPAVSSASSVASSNGYAKIQPIKAAQFVNGLHRMNGGGNQQQSALMNGNERKLQNGGHANNNGLTNGHSNNNTENFADFDHAPIYNAADLPMTNGFSNNVATSANAYNNNTSSMPAEDRYAALKDLDEQLRESKAVAAIAAGASAADVFGNNNNANGNVNPFTQQQQQQQHAAIVNPFQAAQQQNLFGQMSTLTNGVNDGFLTNGFQQQQAAQQQQNAFFNYSNGFSAAGATATMYPTPAPSSGPNGCGFGFGSMQTAAGGAFNNPFAATGGALNSNNPFL